MWPSKEKNKRKCFVSWKRAMKVHPSDSDTKDQTVYFTQFMINWFIFLTTIDCQKTM